MVTLKFPALHNALQKSMHDVDPLDVKSGVYIYSNRAYILQDDFLLICNLYDYFTIEGGVETDEQLKGLNSVLSYLNGKVINKALWIELTKESVMKVDNGRLSLHSEGYVKDYKIFPSTVKATGMFNRVKTVIDKVPTAIQSLSLPMASFNFIYSTLKKTFNSEHIIFEFCGQANAVKFTFRKRKHIYGYIIPHYDSANEEFKFEDFNTICEELNPPTTQG